MSKYSVTNTTPSAKSQIHSSGFVNYLNYYAAVKLPLT